MNRMSRPDLIDQCMVSILQRAATGEAFNDFDKQLLQHWSEPVLTALYDVHCHPASPKLHDASYINKNR